MTTALPVQPVQPTTSLWQDLRTTLSAIFGTVVAVARTTEKASLVVEKTVQLAENEVDNIDEMQQQRLDLTRHEREQQKAIFASQMSQAKRAATLAAKK